MIGEKKPIDRIRSARDAVYAIVRESVRRELQRFPAEIVEIMGYEVNGPTEIWTDRFMTLRALKQQGDHAAFLNPTDEEDCARWRSALCERLRIRRLKSRYRVRTYREYMSTLFGRTMVDDIFPRDALDRVIAILNHPSLSEIWSLDDKDVREYIERRARNARLKDMRLLSEGRGDAE